MDKEREMKSVLEVRSDIQSFLDEVLDDDAIHPATVDTLRHVLMIIDERLERLKKEGRKMYE